MNSLSYVKNYGSIFFLFLCSFIIFLHISIKSGLHEKISMHYSTIACNARHTSTSGSFILPMIFFFFY